MMELPNPAQKKQECAKWYVMRVTYGRELAAKEKLETMAGRVEEVFLPMRYEYVVRGGKKTRKLCPSVHNLVFARTTRQEMDDIKKMEIPYLRYFMCHDGAQSFPMTVRDEDMQNFMRVARRVEEDIRYVSAEDFDIQAGERVLITGGAFANAEGVLVKVKGCRSKRVVVSLDNFLHLATATVPINLIERIKN